MSMNLNMKKTTLSLAIAALLPAFTYAEKVEVELPEFYGKINVSVQNTQEGDTSVSEVVSNASRLGVRGKIELNHGLQGIYQAEYETQADDGDKSGKTFSQRNTFAGIKGGFGEIIVGIFDTPLKKAQKKIDLFNDLEGDIKSAISDSDQRKKDTVQYSTPNISGIVATVAHISSEKEDINDGTSSSLTYTYNKLYTAIAYDTDVLVDTDVLRLVAQYSISDFTIGALWEDNNSQGSVNDGDGWVTSLAYKLNSDIKLKAQYGESDIVKEDAKTYSLGADYKLGEGAKAYAFITDEEFGDNSSNEYYGMGIEYKF